MSYILDALRRAEADRERERGQVPGLHTQPLSGSEAASAAGPRRWLPWVGGGVLLLAGIAAGGWWVSSRPGDAAPAPVAAPSPAVAAQPATPPLVSAPVAQPAASASPFLPPAPPPGTATPAPAPVLAAVPAPVPVPSPAASAVETPIPRLAELPESTRRELPKLVIGGSVYSDDPASRLVIVNGEVLHEGARLGADLVLEQIRPRELVLRFKGQRYRQPV